MAALAYPDRIGLRRRGEAPRFVLSGGKGAVLTPEGEVLYRRVSDGFRSIEAGLREVEQLRAGTSTAWP